MGQSALCGLTHFPFKGGSSDMKNTMIEGVKYSLKKENKKFSKNFIYQTEDGLTKIDVSFENDTVWLSKSQMVELFQRNRSVISSRIKNLFEEGELSPESNVHNLHIANFDKPVDFYSLNVIISIVYRVKSQRGVQFHIWPQIS